MKLNSGKRKFPWKSSLDSRQSEGMVDTPLKIGISRRVSRLAGYGTVATSWPFNPIRRKGTRVVAFHRAFRIRAYVSASIRVHVETHVRLTEDLCHA